MDHLRSVFVLRPDSTLKGQRIEYRTSNPCTIVNPTDLGLVVEEKMNWDSLYDRVMNLNDSNKTS